MVRSVVLSLALAFAGSAWAQNPANPNSQPPLPGNPGAANPNTQPPIPGGANGQSPVDANSSYAATPPLFSPAPNAGPAHVHAIRVSGAVMESQILNKVDPAYPASAKSERIQGAVVLAVRIGKDGSVQDLQAISGPPALSDAAINAVKQWTYKPYLLNGQPVEVHTTVTVTFQLNAPPRSS